MYGLVLLSLKKIFKKSTSCGEVFEILIFYNLYIYNTLVFIIDYVTLIVCRTLRLVNESCLRKYNIV